MSNVPKVYDFPQDREVDRQQLAEMLTRFLNTEVLRRDQEAIAAAMLSERAARAK